VRSRTGSSPTSNIHAFKFDPLNVLLGPKHKKNKEVDVANVARVGIHRATFCANLPFAEDSLFFTINLTGSSKLEELYALDSRRSQ
jgi:hypothetical protein